MKTTVLPNNKITEVKRARKQAFGTTEACTIEQVDGVDLFINQFKEL